jgi:hypothetical protein
MDSRWNDADARKAVESYAKKGVGEALALRTYRWLTCWARRTRCCA